MESATAGFSNPVVARWRGDAVFRLVAGSVEFMAFDLR